MHGSSGAAVSFSDPCGGRPVGVCIEKKVANTKQSHVSVGGDAIYVPYILPFHERNRVLF